MGQLFSAFLAAESFPHEGRQNGTHERSTDEHPEVAKNLAASEESRSDGTSRVDGGTGQVDADEVDENQRQTDGETGEVASTHFAVSSAQHHQDKEERGNDLHEEGTASTASVGHTIGAETLHILSDVHAERAFRSTGSNHIDEQ